jgi:hypothetical protein
MYLEVSMLLGVCKPFFVIFRLDVRRKEILFGISVHDWEFSHTYI